jgi:uncharacterized protein (DUF433 family)
MPMPQSQSCPSVADLVVVDPEIMGGVPVFRGTRVPVRSLFDHLAHGVSLDEFLDDFPYVTREQAVALLRAAQSGLFREVKAA